MMRSALRARLTEMSEAQRLALAAARDQLRAYFPGETVRLYVPRSDAQAMADQRQRIASALRAGESATSIARREGVSKCTVHRVRGMFQLPP